MAGGRIGWFRNAIICAIRKERSLLFFSFFALIKNEGGAVRVGPNGSASPRGEIDSGSRRMEKLEGMGEGTKMI